MKIKLLFFYIILIIGFCSFIIGVIDKPVRIPASKQRAGGDSAKGYDYLTTGDYVKGGIPYNIYLLANGMPKVQYMKRDGLNTNLNYDYTAVKADNGEILIAPNCLQCHAQVVNDKLVIGLGNSLIDFSNNEKLKASNFDMLEKILQKNAPKQYEASLPFITVSKMLAPYLKTNTRGVNLADHLAALLVSHRDPLSFKWQQEAALVLPEIAIPTDTPPWWLLKKKNAMFYNGFGRGDFGRFLMASNLLTVNDSSESAQVDKHMPDVLAYINSLEPPPYPYKTDATRVAAGRVVFNQNCAKCHGTYGKEETYPNLLIPESIIQTDSLLFISNYSAPQFVSWFNKSWFTQGDHPARLEPYNGYIAPPLDGIWISAPYLHNGSVPSLEALLNSKLRPECWTRDFDHLEYDEKEGGWKYTRLAPQSPSPAYNTKLTGYGNGGHYFGDHLSPEERTAVIEYLKTL